MKKRGDIDIAQFSLPTFEIDARASRFPKKMNAQQALQTLPALQAMGDVFKAVFGIYHRKLCKLIDAVLVRVAGSVILMWLQSGHIRRCLNLLKFIGRDPWESGWDWLWSEPCLYLVFPFPLRVCKHGLAFYVGESVCFSSRFREHLCRIVDVVRPKV